MASQRVVDKTYFRAKEDYYDHYYSLKLQIYKWNIQDVIKECWDGINLKMDENHPIFANIDQDIFCKTLACTIYQYYTNESLEFFNRLWGKKMVEMGAPKNPKYAAIVNPSALNKFLNIVRKKYSW